MCQRVSLFCCVTVAECLAKRLRDPVEDVRLQALSSLIEVALKHPAEFSAATFQEMGERVKDRRVEIKHAALRGLAKMYAQHVSCYLPPLGEVGRRQLEQDVDSDRDDDEPTRKNRRTTTTASRARGRGSSSRASSAKKQNQPPLSIRATVRNQEMLQKLSFIPSLLLKCWSYPDLSTKHVIVHMLQEQILPKKFVNEFSETASDDRSDAAGTSKEGNLDTQSSSSSGSHSSPSIDAHGEDINERRATALLLMNELLAEEDRKILASLIAFKTKVSAEVAAFLQVRSNVKRSAAGAYGAIERSFNAAASSASSSSSTKAQDGEQMMEMRRCMVRIMQLAPPQDRRASLLEKLYVAK